MADAVVETHDRIVGKTWREAKKLCGGRIEDARSALKDTHNLFKTLGVALLEAKGDGASLDVATEAACGWGRLEELVAAATELTGTMSADPLTHVLQGYHRFQRYAPRMLRALDIQFAPVARPLFQAARSIADGCGEDRSIGFIKPSSKWCRHLKTQKNDDHRFWEVAVLFHLRDALRSGDI